LLDFIQYNADFWLMGRQK